MLLAAFNKAIAGGSNTLLPVATTTWRLSVVCLCSILQQVAAAVLACPSRAALLLATGQEQSRLNQHKHDSDSQSARADLTYLLM